MSFGSRSEFITAQSSEKLTLAHVHANKRLHLWTNYISNIWVRDVEYFVTELKVETTSLTNAGSKGSVTAGTFAYEPAENKVYVWMSDSSDPNLSEMICTFRFFYSTGPVTLSWDLTDTGKQTFYNGRIENAPGFKHKVGVDQKLVSIIGQGDLKLENNDGGLDDIYDTLIFENQVMEVYSWNRDLPFSSAKKIYRGRVTNKRYNADSVVFKIKDELFDLLQNVPQIAYDDTDNVSDSIKGNYKRWLYGRVDGLKLQSIDQIVDGYSITGTVAASPASAILTGTGTTFLADCSPDDTITVGTQEFSVLSVQSNTSLTLDDEPAFSFTAQTVILNPSIPTVTKNRDFFVAGHACAELTKTVSSIIQLNRIVLSDTDGLQAGDFVEFATGERIEIKNVAPGNIIVLRKNIILQPGIGSNVIRQPIQDLFIETDDVNSDKFTITNTTECTVTLDSDVEFNIAREQGLGFTATFTNGSRTVTTSGQPDLTQIIKPRDWVVPADIAFTTFYEVLQVNQTSFELRTAFSDANHTGSVNGKLPNYIGDDTVISGNVLGKTDDGTASGSWIRYGADAVKDLLSEISITDIDTASFTEGAIDNQELISIAIPLQPTGTAVSTKSIIDKINKSISSALTLNTDLQLQYRVLLPEVPDEITEIDDNQVVTWSISSVNGDLIRNSLIRYRHKDIDRYSQESGNSALSHSSDFVEKYVGTNVTQELDVYLYNERSARIMSHREVYFRSLARAEIRIETDLRFENLDIGDSVVLNFDRLYKRFGDEASRKKVCIIVGKTVTGEKVELFCSDFGNVLNRSSIITPNTAPDWTSATEDEKLKYGYITTANGLVDDDEDTNNTHLIT